MKHLFLDLEDTVITPATNGWVNTQLINVQKVKAFIDEFKPDFVHVFSFAIWDAAQLRLFNIDPRPRLESRLGVKFSAVPTVDEDMIPVAARVMGMGRAAVNFEEMSNFWSKQQTFRLNMQHMFKSAVKDVEVVLLDDAVMNEEFYWPDLKVRGRILNIDQMP